MLQIRWRQWLTGHYLRNWLSERTYYRMQLTGQPGRQPGPAHLPGPEPVRRTDAGPVASASSAPSVTLLSFVGILWAISGPLSRPARRDDLDDPGYMVWAALVYAVAGTWLTHLIGRPLVRLNYDQQRYEADFRFGLVRCARTPRASRSTAARPGRACKLPATASASWCATGGTSCGGRRGSPGSPPFYGQLAVIFPFLVAAPRYFSGAIQLGGLMQIASAFGQVQGALSWFVDAYTSLAEWKATVDRLTGFQTQRWPRARRRRARADRGRARAAATPALSLQSSTSRLPTGRSCCLDGSTSNSAGRVGAGDRRLGHRQEHPVPRPRRDLAVRRRDACAVPAERPRPVPAAAALSAARHSARRGELSGAHDARRARSSRRWPQSGLPGARGPAARGGELVAAACRPASSSASRSPARCSRGPTGCSSTRRLPRSTSRRRPR